MRSFIILLLLAIIVGLPFVLRPPPTASEQTGETLVVVTPHNEAIRHEFGRGFAQWYRARTGRSITVDWRVLGGTSEIDRYLEGAYVAAFQNYWTGLGRPWSNEVQSSFQDGRLPPTASPLARQARDAFLQSQVSCGIDVFFGGGAYDFEQQAAGGRIVTSDVIKKHPDWFTDADMPQRFDGAPYWDPQGRWFGAVISSYGIIYNLDALQRLHIERAPSQWSDLADPRLMGEVALCDPTKSGSIAMAFENLIEQQMQDRLGRMPEKEAVREGWLAGLCLLQRIGANARYFTDTSQKPPIDVADGNCAAGMCIDFYGTQEREAIRRRGGVGRLGFVSPAGGTSYDVDPIALLRGAPHHAAAEAFIEYVLSLDGQKLWAFSPGTPGGPQTFSLLRSPVRKDFYEHGEWKDWRSSPDQDPYSQSDLLIYRPQWTGPVFREMAVIIRVMCEDTHDELVGAWRAIQAAPQPRRSQALAAMQDISFVSYDQTLHTMKPALESMNQVEEVRFTTELTAQFRTQYAKAKAIAGSGP